MLDIVVDTREQTPWVFPVELATVRRGTLNAGDYALDGDYNFAIERKSLDDYVGTVSRDWDRFQRELDRMRAAQFPALVVIVEGGLLQIILGQYNGATLPKFIIKRTAQLIMQGCAVVFADNPETAAGMAYRILKERHQEINGNNKGESDKRQRQAVALPKRDGLDDHQITGLIKPKLYRKRRYPI